MHLPLLDMVRKKKTEEMEGTADRGVNEAKENTICRNFRFRNLSHIITQIQMKILNIELFSKLCYFITVFAYDLF